MGGGTSKEAAAAGGSPNAPSDTKKPKTGMASKKGVTVTNTNAALGAAAIQGTTPQTLDLQTAVTPVGAAVGPGKASEIQVVACDVDDLKDGEMREVEIGGDKALLVRDNGEYHAIGPKCSHFGAPLVKGALCNGHIRCPWHGACFNIRTGDIEDFPGLDSLQKFDVDVTDGKVRIRATEQALSTKKRQKEMTCCAPDDPRTFLIVGGGGATIACAETLRQEGFKGKVIVATKETCLPYDRTTLSKALQKKAEDMAVRKPDFYSVYDIEVKTGLEATSVDTDHNCVTFKNGDEIKYDKLMIATGGSPRTLTLPGSDLENVCVLRTPADANHIARETSGKDVVIIGTSFIGMEIAAYGIQKNAKSVTVIGRSDVPFKQSLGDAVGGMWKKLHESKGVRFIAENSARELVGEGGRLKEVVLQDGTVLPADILIMGVGVYPTTTFLEDSGLMLTDRGYVIVDKHMKTSEEGVYAAGDIVVFPLFIAGDEEVNVQHWQMAHAHGRCAALNMLDQNVEVKSVPFFWTMMYGKSVRYTGYGAGYDDVIFHGEDTKFVAFYTKRDRVVAVASLGWDPICAQAAEMFYGGKTITKAEVQESADGWVSRLH